SVRAHWTPGHSKDHLVLQLLEENSLFSGDCVLGEGTVVFEDLSTYLESLQTILKLQPRKLYPGHGPVVEDPIAKVNEYIEKRLQREREIVQVLTDSQGRWISAMDIFKSIYKVT